MSPPKSQNMACTVPQVSPDRKKEYAEYTEKFLKMTGDFTAQLTLPSPMDPSTLAYVSRISPQFVKELQDLKIIKSFISNQVDSEIDRTSVSVDTSKIIDDVSKYITSSVDAAKVTSTFGGLLSTTYTGKYFETDVYFKVTIVLLLDDASKFYGGPKVKSVFEMAFWAYFVVAPVN